MEPSSIRQLDETVVNRIAAGEVIQRPWNAVKELVENCLDAGATSVTVTVKEGGLRLLQVADNGCGVARVDLPLLCQRFATSKLREYDDLRSLATFGFRGEALASISHVAHVTVTSRPRSAAVAHRALYRDGQLDGPVQSCAGNPGTCVSAADLFYNVPTRRRALRSTAEEHGRVLEVLTKYAVHRPDVGWTLKKDGGGGAAVELRSAAGSASRDNVRALYGNALARELLEVSHREERLGLRVAGLVSNANYSAKRLHVLLFINERLVDSAVLRRALAAVYAALLPKHAHPWVYLALQLPAATLDVNVHPTKHEVHFLHEEAVAAAVQTAVERVLLASGQSRAFYTKSLLPPVLSGVTAIVEQARAAVATPPPSKMVRTDPQQHKLTAFYGRPAQTAASSAAAARGAESAPLLRFDNTLATTDAADGTEERGWKATDGAEAAPAERCWKTTDGAAATPAERRWEATDGAEAAPAERCWEATDGAAVTPAERRWEAVDDAAATPVEGRLEAASVEGRWETADAVAAASVKVVRAEAEPSSSYHAPVAAESLRPPTVDLLSVNKLRAEVRADAHACPELRDMLRSAVWVGSVDAGRALVQHDTRLLLLDLTALTADFFYQQALFEFGRLGVLRLSEPACVEALAALALSSPSSGWQPQDGCRTELARFAARLLREKAAMLWDYFSVQIDAQGRLAALPLLLEGYVPDLDALPLYVLRLATEVEWEQEEACFRSFCRETARFYAIKPPLFPAADDATSPEEAELGAGQEAWKWRAEHVLFKALRSGYLPSKARKEDGSLLQVASLPELYKVFERC